MPAAVEGQWGYIDRTGEWVIEPQFERCLDFNASGLTFVEKENKSYLIDTTGRLIKQFDVSELVRTKNQLLVHRKWQGYQWLNGETGYHDTSIYDNIEILYNQVVCAQTSNGYLFFDRHGNPLFSDSVSSYELLSPGIILEHGNQFSFYQPNVGMLISKVKNPLLRTGNLLYSLVDSLMIWSLEGEHLVTTQSSHSPIPLNDEYFVVMGEKGNLLFSQKENTPILIDHDQYELLRLPLIVVSDNSGQRLYHVNRRQWVSSEYYEQISLLPGSELLIAFQDGMMKLLSSEGKDIGCSWYSSISSTQRGDILVAVRNGKRGLLNTDGNPIVSPQYASIATSTGEIVKCRSELGLTLYEIRAGEVLDSMVFKNSKVIKLGGQVRLNAGTIARDQMISSNWFLGKSGKYGLKRDNGYVTIPPVYTRLTKIPGTPFVLAEINQSNRITYNRGLSVHWAKSYQVVDEKRFKRISPYWYKYVDTTSLRDSTLHVFRALLKNGRFMIVNKLTGETNHFQSHYIGKFKDGLARIYIGKGYLSNSGVKKDTVISLRQFAAETNGLITGRRALRTYSVYGDGEWLYLNSNGELLKNPYKKEYGRWSRAGNFTNGRAVVRLKNGLYGLIDKNLTYVLLPRYSHIRFEARANNELLIARTGFAKSGYQKIDGTVITTMNYQTAGKFYPDYAIAHSNRSYVAVDTSGEWAVFDPGFRIVSTGDRIFVAKKQGRYVLIDSLGNYLTEDDYSFIGTPSEGIVPFRFGRSMRFMNYDGQEVARGDYVKCGSFQNGITWVRYRTKRNRTVYSFVRKEDLRNPKGKYLRAYGVNEHGFAKVKKRNGAGLVDTLGQLIIPARFRKFHFTEGFITATSRKKVVVFNHQGERLIKLRGRGYYGVYDSCLVVRKKKGYGLVHVNGTQLLDYGYRKLSPSANGLVASQTYRGMHLINHNGDTVAYIPGKLCSPLPSPYYLVVGSGGNHSFFDQNGVNVFDRSFQRAHAFEDGVARVNVNGNWGIIDTSGYYRIAPQYSYISAPSNGVVVVSKSHLSGICDLNGEFLTSESCSRIEYLANQNVFRYWTENQIGYVSTEGTIIHKHQN
jgi:hypothetical protein